MNDDVVDAILCLRGHRQAYLENIKNIYREIDPRLRDFLEDEIDIMIEELEGIMNDTLRQ